MIGSVEIDGLEFTYPDGREALRGVDLAVPAGERLAILGPNGAGKTTLALHLNGILRGQKGSVTVSGLELDDGNLKEIRRRVGLVFQDPNDQLFMPTVHEDVAFGPANLGLTEEEIEGRVAGALEAVEGTEFSSRPPHHLSGGEKRRAALATVLSMNPEILVFDEPTGGLDPAGRKDLVELLLALDHTQLIITHDMSLALELCPRTAIMNQGRVVAAGETRQLLSDDALLMSNRLQLPFGLTLDRGEGAT
jgi:cobalt transport protein ATP-binding subunit